MGRNKLLSGIVHGSRRREAKSAVASSRTVAVAGESRRVPWCRPPCVRSSERFMSWRLTASCAWYFVDCKSRPMKQRVLVFIVAYNAQATIKDVVRRIPRSLGDKYDVEVLIIDDASQDATFEVGHRLSLDQTGPLKLRVLFNPVNQGYGGNQKLGYHYAIENGFDFVALVHGDGQYAPECLPDLLEPLSKGEADAVFGSRMLTPRAALRGGMPMYKYVGNKILTWLEN